MKKDLAGAQGLQTKCIHAAREFNRTSAISPPIWQTTTFLAESSEHFAGLAKSVKPSEYYSRYDRLVPVHERERLKMMEHYSFPDTTPAAYGPYSHAVVAGDFVFLAGQVARDAVSGHLIDGDITAQTARCLEIVSDILKKLGLSLADVVRTTVFLSDIGDFDAMNRVYAAAFQAPYPVRSTPQVKMPFGALVGIEVTAYRGRPTQSVCGQ